MKPFYLTTTLPYVNDKPHIGFALEIVHADAVVRTRRLRGEEVFFNTGTDEHGIKIYRKAQEAGEDPQRYVDTFAASFRELKEILHLSELNFIRTTDPNHKLAAQAFWTKCWERGDIYKKNYTVRYCVGCELEKTDSELVNGHCPIHPNLEIELIEEENYFFRFSRYQAPLLSLYQEHPDFVLPDFRFNEIKAFVERGLEDFSVSRLKSKMPWGIPVPNDADHVMYVWFDALVNYVSAVGWPHDLTKFEKWWPVVQMAGKDNLRQQAAMWQAMLMSAGLPPSRQIVMHGFITSGGQKMSKSLGNVVSPYEIISLYGAEALRYFLLRHTHPFEDADFTMEKFKEAYNADLANGLGNLLSRIMKMSLLVNIVGGSVTRPSAGEIFLEEPTPLSVGFVHSFELHRATQSLWDDVRALNAKIQNDAAFEVIKTDIERAKGIIAGYLDALWRIAVLLEPFMPETSSVMKKIIESGQMPEAPLFPRME